MFKSPHDWGARVASSIIVHPWFGLLFREVIGCLTAVRTYAWQFRFLLPAPSHTLRARARGRSEFRFELLRRDLLLPHYRVRTGHNETLPLSCYSSPLCLSQQFRS